MVWGVRLLVRAYHLPWEAYPKLKGERDREREREK